MPEKRSDQGSPSGHSLPDASPELLAVLESAARVQQTVPDAVLVGGSAAALYAGHRDSYDHDHVLADLRDRFDVVLEALESEGEWVTNRVVPGKVILGQLGDIEAGVRQMIRTRPLETTQVRLPSGRMLTVPTAEETLRVKGFLIVRRNQTRDYLDVAALADGYGLHDAAGVLARIDDYYTDQHGRGRGVAAQLVRQLADPRPRDSSVTRQLDAYRNLASRWTDWGEVRSVCAQLAAEMLEAEA
jgi:ribosomal protein S18 acetylase RimI-like enzyme